MSTPTNLLHTETTTQGGTRRLTSSLEELEDPKEEGSYGDASKNVHGAKMHRRRWQRLRSCKLSARPRTNTQRAQTRSRPKTQHLPLALGIGTHAVATAWRRPTKTPKALGRPPATESRSCISSHADDASGL
jgi:hypothetical protein